MAMLNKYLFLAIKNLKRRGLRSWLTMLGIFIGIAAVVSLISLGSGLQNAITGQFSSLGTDKLVMTNAETGFGPPGSSAVKKLTDHDVDVIKSVNGVSDVIPRLLRVVKTEYNKAITYSYAVSMPDNDKQFGIIYKTINLDAEQGRLLQVSDKGKVLLGNQFSKTKDYGKDVTVGSNINIQGKDFQIVGILNPSSTFTINSAMLLNEKDMKDILNLNNEWDMIIIIVANGFDTEQVAKDISEKIRKDRKEKEGEEDFSVQTPSQSLQSVNTVLSIINLIIVGIATISLIVGGIGIANTMYTSVLERRKEIGVMKAIGARNSDVLKIFLFESGLLGLVGGIIGALMGLLLALGLSGVANTALGTKLLSVEISWPLLIGSIAFSLFIGVLSGVLPAMQASKLKPVDALRG